MRLTFARTLILLQLFAAARVVVRLVCSGLRQERLVFADIHGRDGNDVTVALPVLNESKRIDVCLSRLIALDASVRQILIIDGGSSDDTVARATFWSSKDHRIEVIDASPVPSNWNGKAWGLESGLRHTSEKSNWLFTVDADVLLSRDAISIMRETCISNQLASISLATSQIIPDILQGIVHPSLLATLVYRFGMPNIIVSDVDIVQANGQCALYNISSLEAIGGFIPVRASRCEDVTLARLLVTSGEAIGFFEAEELAAVTMYTSAEECVRSWPRSLSLRDQISNWKSLASLAELHLVQGLPLPVVVATQFWGVYPSLRLLNLTLLCLRLGILAGTRRAYIDVTPIYWLSPVFDFFSSILLIMSAMRRRHSWRGRQMIVDPS